MKKILILCDMFPPAFGPRMGYLCKYLKASGWEAVVLTEAIPDQTFTFLTGNCPVTYIDYFPARTQWLRKLQWVVTFVLNCCFGYKEHRFYQEAGRLIRKQGFDLILCSTYRTFPLPAALKAARRYNLPLVADTRDIIEQYTGNEYITHTLPKVFGLDKLFARWFKWANLRTRNRVLRQADYVTTVSPWHAEVMKQYNPKVELIYNGFDPELFFPEQPCTPQFVITYTGRLLSTAMRDPSLLLEALARLTDEGVLTPTECRVHWYVDEASRNVIVREAEQAGVSAYMDFKGYVPASSIPAVLNHSSVLLLLTNRSVGTGPKGIMTTKFFESLAVQKPILCVRSDESYLESALHEAKAGLSARTVEEVCDFLRLYYTEWKVKGYTTSAANPALLQAYSRKEQARQFMQIFDQLTHSQTHG